MRILSIVTTTITLFAQGGPSLDVALEPGDSQVPALTVSMRDLLADSRFLRTMHSGFPLYVEYTAEVREARSNWFDRTAATHTWEFVVLHDPVRESYVAEEATSTVDLPNERELRDYLARVFVIRQLTPDGMGRFYYRVSVDARTLSDEDVNEVFDWLKGEGADSNELRDRGLLTRAARGVLVRVAPLPQLTLRENSSRFEIR